ncbi:MAG: hypothetical protein K1X74_01520 [Pirellulales bacterium]|nr:hypothetical protein [Pirellulales bacterium]
MSRGEPIPEAVVLGDERWRVVFTWHGDRYGHELQARQGDHWRTLACSVEGTAEEVWPASPPLQQLHCETRPGGVELALGVGMAGRSHWSASVAFDRAQATLDFDLACRVFEAPAWLGSRYRGAGTELFRSVESAGGAFVARDESIAIGAPSDAAELPRTVRWAYRVAFPA